MKRRHAVGVVTVSLLLVFGGVIATGTGRARAAAAAYDRNMIMSSEVFDAVGTMSTAQIQSFLDRFPNSCLRNFRDRIPTGYSSYDGTGSAAQVIRSAATLWDVNPQVLLATLEKEQSVVTGGAGCASWRYWSAMGYGCPDGGAQYSYPTLGISSTCVSSINWAGFSAQVNRGAWQLQFNRQRAEGNLAWKGFSSTPNYGFNTAGYRQTKAGAPLLYYDGWATIDGTAVYMTNGVTATLYTYTPHLYANRAFSDLFTNWFGSTTSPTPTTVAPTAPPTTIRPTSATDLTYIDRVHRVFLGRAATAGEKHLWGIYLTQGGSRSGFVGHVVGTTEYNNNLVSNAYLSILDRTVDSSGLASWTNVLVSTGRDDSMYAGLTGSSEYFKSRAKSDNLHFLDAMYWDFLGRPVDLSGVATWGSRLVDGSMNRTQVSFAVLQSDEYARRVVGRSYALVLGRWPDPSGWDYWTGTYTRTHRSAGIAASLAASPEGYANLSS